MYQKGDFFSGEDFYASDLSNLCVSIASLEVKKKNYVENICELTKSKLK